MMDENNRNFILALALSALVLFGWELFISGPHKAEQAAAQKAAQLEQQAAQKVEQKSAQPATQKASSEGTHLPQSVSDQKADGVRVSADGAKHELSRKEALAASPRVAIETPNLSGSIALKGGRIDDLTLLQFSQTTKPDSPKVVLLSPSKTADPFFEQSGWLGSVSNDVKLPNDTTVWKLEKPGALTPQHPVTLVYDNGKGLVFRRRIAVDDKYMFSITHEVENKSGKSVVLQPYDIIVRHGTPKVAGLYFMHEGFIGVTDKLQEVKYSSISDIAENDTKNIMSFSDKGGWLGITDKYWATAMIPPQDVKYKAEFQYYKPSSSGGREAYQAYYEFPSMKVAAGATETVSTKLFAGAKLVNVINAYEAKYTIKDFGRVIEWGWFPFITKPLFYGLDYFYHVFGNFGIAILIVTVLVKLLFFPLANKSYASMSKMKKLQPEMERVKQRYPDDKMKQQQAIMDLYKKEKVNPMAGCLPMVIQIPVFFALYKVLYVSIEMRQAPFFGWIHDLSVPDPTSMFNLFGLIPWTPPAILMVGAWPLIMGISMWVQMKLNPASPDPMQQKIFAWMPVFFTYLLHSFPAGLVIYWTWNNILSVAQQWYIMRRHGVEVNLLENMGIPKLIGAIRKGGPAE
ncbi:MAG: membrane protein insertase YidC [Alphaproteobacteria bacterium]